MPITGASGSFFAGLGANVLISAGLGSPEGVFTAYPGSLWLQTDAGLGHEVIWRKLSGTGSTGWSKFPDLPGPVFNVKAYGAGSGDSGPAWNTAALAASTAGGGFVYVPGGTYALTTAFTFTGISNVTLVIAPGVILTGQALPVDPAGGNMIVDWRAEQLGGAFNISGDITAKGGFRQTIDGWYQENVAASQIAVPLTRLATTTEVPTRWITMRYGSITGVSVKSNAARTNGTLTITVYKNGGALALTAILDATNTLFKATTQVKDNDTFAPGDELELRIDTTGTWTPVTADIRASLEIES